MEHQHINLISSKYQEGRRVAVEMVPQIHSGPRRIVARRVAQTYNNIRKIPSQKVIDSMVYTGLQGCWEGGGVRQLMGVMLQS